VKNPEITVMSRNKYTGRVQKDKRL